MEQSVLSMKGYSTLSRSLELKLYHQMRIFCGGGGEKEGYYPFAGGARGVMVTVLGNGHGDTSSNLGRD